MRLNGRLAVFCALILLQTGIILLMNNYGNAFVQGKLRKLITDQIMADNVAFTAQLEKTIERMKLYDLRIGADDWHVLQEIIESSPLPRGGYLSVFDLDTNRFICHPSFRDEPELAEKSFPVWETLVNSGKMLEFKAKKVVRIGKMELNDETCWIAGRTLGEFRVALLALQKQDLIDDAIAAAALPVSKLYVAVPLLGLFMVTLFGIYVLCHTERKLQDAFEEVDRLTEEFPSQARSMATAPLVTGKQI